MYIAMRYRSIMLTMLTRIFTAYIKQAKINYSFKMNYVSSILELANHFNIALNKGTLMLLHPLGGFEHYGLLKHL